MLEEELCYSLQSMHLASEDCRVIRWSWFDIRSLYMHPRLPIGSPDISTKQMFSFNCHSPKVHSPITELVLQPIVAENGTCLPRPTRVLLSINISSKSMIVRRSNLKDPVLKPMATVAC